MRLFLLFLVAVLLVFSGRGYAEDAATDSFVFTIENDSFGNGADRHYTSGLLASWETRSTKWANFVKATSKNQL